LINVLPVSGLIAFGHRGHSFVADHFVYLPLVGLALVIARAVELLDDGLKDRPHMRNAALICMYGLVCVLSVLAMKQTWLWRDPASLWEATLKVNKTSPAVYNNYAWVLMSRGELDRAIELFKKAAELAPGLEAPYQNLGRIYHSLGNREAARQMFERASALNPRSNFPRIMLGIMLREEGKHEESVEFLKKCVKANPGSALLRIELAQSYYGASRVSEAITELDRAIKLDPLLPGGYVHKAMILLSQGEPEQAAILLEKSIGLGPSAEAHNMLGVAYATRGNLQKAFDEFSKAYGMNPGLSGVRDNVANSLIEMNQLAAAQEFCAEVARLGRPCSEHVLKKLTGKYDRGA
jgi:tetratricopeptide (TPR) repeat protein